MAANGQGAIDTLRAELEGMFPGYHAVATSRGTSALYLALLAIRLGRGPGEVIVPATVCPSVPLAVMYAGLTPRFCDVELDTFCLSQKTLGPCLSEATRAVIVVYLFGKTPDIKGVMELSHSKGAMVIEDLALGIGGAHDGILLGNLGDCTILSFHHTKIIHGAGGALLVRDSGLLQIVEEMHPRLPPSLKAWQFRELDTSFNQLTHGLYNLMRARNLQSATTCLAQMGEYYRGLFLFQKQFSPEEIDALVKNLRRLPDQRAARRRTYQIYQAHLKEGLNYVRFSPNEMCWRLPILLDNHQQQVALVEKIRNRGMLISNHYFPASYLFGDAGPARAREIGLRAVNFWVDEKAKPEHIPMICEEVNASLA
jgi:dTDP-4-amino-4,6-dideoxygalactose transaminase